MFEQRKDGRLVSYEIGKVKSDNGGQIGDRIIEPGERFWSDNDFGSIAWTITDRNRAEEKFSELESLPVKTQHT